MIKKNITLFAYLEGEYNVKDLCVGVPTVIGKNGVEEILNLKLKH